MKETSRETGINSHYRKVSEVDLINLGRLPLTSAQLKPLNGTGIIQESRYSNTKIV